MIKLIKSMLELFGIVFLRFRALPRAWCVWLVAVNLACLYFINHIEAQVVLAVTVISVVLQSVMYQSNGFTRVLGIVHLSWIPMFAWMAARMDSIQLAPDLALWLSILFLTNLISMVIDTSDVTRFILGERRPHYFWVRTEPAG